MRQLWQWFRNLVGQIFNPGGKVLQGSSPESDPHQTLSEETLLPLSETDYEFLFRQLMEGVAQGWQVERVTLFFEKLGDRSTSDEWLGWLRAYRTRLLGGRSPQTQHANQMMRVGEMVRSLPKWQPVGEAIYEIGLQLRLRSQGSSLWEYMSPSVTANSASTVPSPAPSATPPQTPPPQPPASDPLPSSPSSETPPEKLDPVDTVNVEASDSQMSPLFSPEPLPDVWDAPPETPEPEPETPVETPEPEPETPAETPEPEPETPAETPEPEPAIANSPELATSVEEYIRQQPVINLAYSAHGQQWTEAVSLNQLVQKLTEMPHLIAQFSQQVGISSQNPEEIVEAIYQQLYQIYQQHQANGTVDEATLLFNQGMQQAKAGNYADAIATWDRALSQQPGLYKAWLNRGNALVMLRQPQAAIESYDKALELQSGLYEAWGNKGVALLNLGKYKEAIAAFDEALKLKSDYPEAWDNRGLALRELGHIQEAIDSFDRALTLKPDDPSVLKHQVETLKLRES
ncbi:tetratricopeptide repeat protein [Roseofilum sp. BLCC_M91]|uniref:Tetratricopeptide repeat protein n=1 Tax=Roseofilum halophilum BLCC-M91 TaxID=3022259 RepID=A0ABT7BDN1_9CYAN|nr:tetratricopeptide repeat protein [Roseofilum halophilum]MDJ1177299.1 tetratricopeptide repeat protein [Roseofilum halophilum BLCC-M91]